MRRKNQEITSPKIIEEILSKSQVCRLGLIDNGMPYIVPVNYGYFNNAIYIHSAPVGKKIDLIKQNSQVCFELELICEITPHEEPCHWSSRYRSIIGYGSMEIITDHEQKKLGLDVIMSHYGKQGKNVYNDEQVRKMVILKLTIAELTAKQSSNWVD